MGSESITGPAEQFVNQLAVPGRAFRFTLPGTAMEFVYHNISNETPIETQSGVLHSILRAIAEKRIPPYWTPVSLNNCSCFSCWQSWAMIAKEEKK